MASEGDAYAKDRLLGSPLPARVFKLAESRGWTANIAIYEVRAR